MLQRKLVSLMAAICLTLISPGVWAFPDRPVTLVVPFAAGGATDVLARVVAERLSARWAKPVIVENRPGAGGAIGTVFVARQPADGQTILMHSPAAMVSAELLRDNAGYRVNDEFTPITDAFVTPVVLIAGKTVRARDARSFFEEGRRNGGFSFASHGQGSSTHYFGEQMKATSGISLIHVPMTGEAQMITNVVGGHVTSALMSASGAQKAVDSGSAWVVAVSGSSRWPSLPKVPTFKELGFQGMERMSGAMFLVRKSTPHEIVGQLSKDFALALTDPRTTEATKALGITIVSSTPERAQESLKAEYREWEGYVRRFGNLTATRQ